MTQRNPAKSSRRRLLAPRRIALMASVTGLGIAILRVQFDGMAHTSDRGNNSERNDNNSRRFGRDFQDFFRQFGFGNQFGDNQFGNRFGDRFGENLPNIPDVPNGTRRTAAEGSGFFISADGYAVTNDHVINNAKSVQVITDDGRTFEAKVVGTDPKTDLALIKVDGDSFPFDRRLISTATSSASTRRSSRRPAVPSASVSTFQQQPRRWSSRSSRIRAM